MKKKTSRMNWLARQVVTVDGERITIAELAKENGVTMELVYTRYRHKWPMYIAATRKTKQTNPYRSVCKGCHHYRPLNSAMKRTSLCCHYLLDEGHTRGAMQTPCQHKISREDWEAINGPFEPDFAKFGGVIRLPTNMSCWPE